MEAATIDGIVPSALVLGVLLVVAVILTADRPLSADHGTRRRLARFTGLAIVVQLGHFLEELAGGFHGAFPALVGRPPMPLAFFVGFNVAWLAIWTLAAVAVDRGIAGAMVPIWFLALGCALNAVAHPVLALAVGGYFPGLATAPAVALVGAALWRRVLAATHSDGDT